MVFTILCSELCLQTNAPGVGQISLHDWMLNITRARHSCTVFAAQAEAMYKPKLSSHCCLLCARCVKLRKLRIQNLSYRLFDMLNLFHCSFHVCPTIMTTSSGAILSLPGIPRARFAKVAQFCCANSAPTARPPAVGSARRVEKHVPRRGSDERVEPLQPKECHRKSEAGRCLRQTLQVPQTERLAPREHGGINHWTYCHILSNASDFRAIIETSSCYSVPNPDVHSKGFSVAHGWWRETWHHSNRSQQPRRRERHTARRRKGRRDTTWDNPSCWCLQHSSMAQ